MEPSLCYLNWESYFSGRRQLLEYTEQPQLFKMVAWKVCVCSVGGYDQKGLHSLLTLTTAWTRTSAFQTKFKKQQNETKKAPNHKCAFLVVTSTRHTEKEAHLNNTLDVTLKDFKQNWQDIFKVKKPKLSLTPSVLDPCSCKVFCRSSICCCNSPIRSSFSLLGRKDSCYPSKQITTDRFFCFMSGW